MNPTMSAPSMGGGHNQLRRPQPTMGGSGGRWMGNTGDPAMLRAMQQRRMQGGQGQQGQQGPGNQGPGSMGGAVMPAARPPMDGGGGMGLYDGSGGVPQSQMIHGTQSMVGPDPYAAAASAIQSPTVAPPNGVPTPGGTPPLPPQIASSNGQTVIPPPAQSTAPIGQSQMIKATNQPPPGTFYGGGQEQGMFGSAPPAPAPPVRPAAPMGTPSVAQRTGGQAMASAPAAAPPGNLGPVSPVSQLRRMGPGPAAPAPLPQPTAPPPGGAGFSVGKTISNQPMTKMAHGGIVPHVMHLQSPHAGAYALDNPIPMARQMMRYRSQGGPMTKLNQPEGGGKYAANMGKAGMKPFPMPRSEHGSMTRPAFQ